ncbi:hypothetical protein [Saccharopolyspora spinosa]|uniref:hypothetical protein n=1 Tax=Saccharopolyspora spinosa TaxID=60894 RepID=UPI00192B214A|nr:hypothetical protein [Saccharopolyspora spinosa]
MLLRLAYLGVTNAYNLLLRSLRALIRRTRIRSPGRTLARPTAHRRQPPQNGDIVQAALALTHHEHGYI